MIAAIYKKYGSPGVLNVQETIKPVPNDDEVLIKVQAATVNRTDYATIRAKPFFARFFTGLFKPKRPVTGTDFAGNIEIIGKNVTKFKIGDKVFGLVDTGISSHAEYMTISENNTLTTIPENISFEEAAASIEGAHYGLNFINKVQLKKGHKVLVNGASGAIGSAIVQLLKYYGADITAVCKGEDTELIKSIGAAQVIDYLNEDFTKSNDKYEFVFDSVGKSSFFKCKNILKPKGIYISSELGYMSQNIFLPLITPVFGGKKVIFPIPKDRMTSVLLIKKLLKEGKYKSVIDRSYPLEEIVKAFKYVGKGEKTGNVIINMEK